jgi:hypothetical protein
VSLGILGVIPAFYTPSTYPKINYQPEFMAKFGSLQHIRAANYQILPIFFPKCQFLTANPKDPELP